MNEVKIETITPRWRILYKIVGIVILIVFLLLLIGIIGLIGDFQPDTTIGWISNNWLVKIIKLNLGISGESIYSFNFLDLLIMVLVGITFVALYPTLRKVSRVWTIIAICEPFVGIVVFIISHSAGRSAVLSGVLTISIIMLWSNNFNKLISSLGILAGGLLLMGDIVSVFALFIIAIILDIGYLLVMIWSILIAFKFFQ
ncbi:MAG: hypothetical protein ACFE8N_12990, partial [Promethearchaeota archaeon]